MINKLFYLISTQLSYILISVKKENKNIFSRNK